MMSRRDAWKIYRRSLRRYRRALYRRLFTSDAELHRLARAVHKALERHDAVAP